MEDMLPFYSAEGSIIYNIDHLLVSSNVSVEDSTNVTSNPSLETNDIVDVITKGVNTEYFIEDQHNLENLDVGQIEESAVEKDNEDDISRPANRFPDPSSNKMRHDSGFVDSPLNLPSENEENQFFASSPGVYVYIPSGNESIPCNEVFVVPPALRDPRCTCASPTQVFLTGQGHSQPFQVFQQPPHCNVYSPSPFPGGNLQNDPFFNSHFYNLNMIQANQHPQPMSYPSDQSCHYSYIPGDRDHATGHYPSNAYGYAPSFPIPEEALHYSDPQMEPVIPTMEDMIVQTVDDFGTFSTSQLGNVSTKINHFQQLPKYDGMLPIFEDGGTMSTPSHAFLAVPNHTIEDFRPGPKHSRKSFWAVPKQNREAFRAGPRQSRNTFWPNAKHSREPYWADSKQRSKTFRTGPKHSREAFLDSPKHNRETFLDGHKHSKKAFRDCNKYSSEALHDGPKHSNEAFQDDPNHNSETFRNGPKHSCKVFWDSPLDGHKHSSKALWDGPKHNSEALQDGPKHSNEAFGDGPKHNSEALMDGHKSDNEAFRDGSKYGRDVDGFKHSSKKAFRDGGPKHSSKAFRAGHIESKQVSLKKIIEPDHSLVAQEKVLRETGSKKVASQQGTEVGAKGCRIKSEVSKPPVDALPLKSHIPGLPLELLIPKKTTKKKKKRKQKTDKEVKSFSSSDETGIGAGSRVDQVISHYDEECHFTTGGIDIMSDNLEPLEANPEEQSQEVDISEVHSPVGPSIISSPENAERKSAQETNVNSIIDLKLDVIDENNSHEGSIKNKQNISSDKTDSLPLPTSKDSPLLLEESTMFQSNDLDNQKEAIPMVKWMEGKVPFKEDSNEDLMRNASDATNAMKQIIDEIIIDTLEHVELSEDNQYVDCKEFQVDQISNKDQNQSVECTGIESKPNLSEASDFEELNNIEDDIMVELHSSVKAENREQSKSMNSFPKRKAKKAKTAKLVLREEEKINREHIELEKEASLMESLEENNLDGKGQKRNKKLRKDKPKLEPISIPAHKVMINDSNWRFVCSNRILHATETLSPDQIESVETTTIENNIYVLNLGEGMHRGWVAHRTPPSSRFLILENREDQDVETVSGEVLDKNEDITKPLQDSEDLDIALD